MLVRMILLYGMKVNIHDMIMRNNFPHDLIMPNSPVLAWIGTTSDIRPQRRSMRSFTSMNCLKICGCDEVYAFWQGNDKGPFLTYLEWKRGQQEFQNCSGIGKNFTSIHWYHNLTWVSQSCGTIPLKGMSHEMEGGIKVVSIISLL